MKKFIFFFFSIFSVCISAQNNNLLNSILNGDFAEKSLPVFHLMQDGAYYAAIANDGKSIVKYDYKTGSALETLFSTDQTNNSGIKKIDKLIWSDDDAQVLIFAENKYHLYDVRRKQIEPLTEQKNPLFPTFSPDGRMIAFVSNNNLYVKKMDFGTEIAITKDGAQDSINNGAADELYRIGFGTEKAFEWSDDSKLLAFIRFDYREVAPYRFALNPNDTVPAIVANRYAKAGENITKTGVYVYDIFYRTTKQMNIPNDDADGQYIPMIRWTQTPERLAVATLNRFQNTLNIYSVNPASTVANLVLQEKSETFVDYRLLDSFKILPNNTFVLAKENTEKTAPETKVGNKEFFANGYLLKPVDFNPGKKYPVVLMCGFDAPQTLDQWTLSFENLLTNEGYIVARADIKVSYWNLGKQEAEEQIAVANYLLSLPYVDAKDINLYGEGAGGYMALRTLAEGRNLFKSAVAVSPITDWRNYNAAVSERYLRTPKANPNGYKQAVLPVENLTGNILLMHNTTNTDIHLQHTLEYANALSDAGKLFDMQLYRNKNQHFYLSIFEFLK